MRLKQIPRAPTMSIGSSQSAGVGKRFSNLLVGPMSGWGQRRSLDDIRANSRASPNMAHVCNISPSHRPPRPSLDRGPVQRRARRAFLASGMEMLSTPQIAEWTHPRGTSRRNAYRYLRDVLERYCIRAARDSGVGRPLLWKLRDPVD
jgi:hypothetical protein